MSRPKETADDSPVPTPPPSWVTAAIRAVPVGVFVTSPTGDCTFVNPRWCELTGLTPAAALGRGWMDALHRDDRERVVTAWFADPTGRVIESHVRVQRPDGAVRWVQCFAVPIFASGREQIGQVGILVDVTERREAELAYRALVENSSQGTVVFQDGRPVFVNRALGMLLGRPRKAMLASRVTEMMAIVHDADRERVRAKVAAFMDGHAAASRFVARIVRPDGAIRCLEAVMSRIEYRGRPALQVAYIDVTERRVIEERLQSMNSELEQRVRERTAQLEATVRELESFSYSVSHDLRAPLRAIDGFSQALHEDYAEQLDERAHEYLRRVRRAAQRMDDLIDNLLTLSRVMRSGFDRIPVDLSGLTTEIADELRRAHPDRVVAFHIAPDLHVTGDRALLRTALDNLLGNAWKFSGGRPEARIEVGAVAGAAPPTFYVRDNGAGFDMAYAEKLFQPFQRLHAPDEFEGSGVGLATVQRIIARHGGRVWGESKPGEGATFYFTLAPG
jgi:PAS domain S-box-containing protein